MCALLTVVHELFKDGNEPPLHLKTQSVPRSKHTPLGHKNQSVNAV